MKLISKPTLQQMALIKAAIELWNQEDIRKLIKVFYKDWQEVEDQVAIHVSHLPLPKTLKENLSCLIKPIGRQIKTWCTCHSKECQALKLPRQFIWTPEGTIDRKRTAEMLVKDEDIDVRSRYKLSCVYCLEHEIPELWNKIPKYLKFWFYIKKSLMNIKVHWLVEYWSYQLSKLDKVVVGGTCQNNPHVHALNQAFKDGNVAAIEFFLNQLSDEERNTLLVRYAWRAATLHDSPCALSESYSEVFVYAYSRMSEDQQGQLLIERPYSALSCFLHWPYQSLFMDSANRTVPLIPHAHNNEVMEFIVYKIANGWTDFDYQQLFQDYWNLIPLEHKRRSMIHFGRLYDIYECGEEDVIETVFKDADTLEKKEKILSEIGRDLCLKLVANERWSYFPY